MKKIILVFIIFYTQCTNAAVYNCNGTFTDKPCGDTPEIRLTPNKGFSPINTSKTEDTNSQTTKKAGESKIGIINTPEPDFCKQLRADLKDARWRKENMIRQETIAKAVEDEKILVDEIWSKCSHRFE